MSTFLIVNNSSYECQTTASQPYLKLNNNGYLPLTTDSASYTYTETHTTTSESTYESVEENVNGFSGMTTVSYEGVETKSFEIKRETITTWRSYNGGAADHKHTYSLYISLDGAGNNSITFTGKDSRSDTYYETYRRSDSLSSTKNVVSLTNFNYPSVDMLDSMAVSQNGNMFLGEITSRISETFESKKVTTAASLIGTQTFITRKTSCYDTATGYIYPSLSITETFSTTKSMPNITKTAYSTVTYTLTETITETISETLTGNKTPLLTNSSRTYYLKG